MFKQSDMLVLWSLSATTTLIIIVFGGASVKYDIKNVFILIYIKLKTDLKTETVPPRGVVGELQVQTHENILITCSDIIH